MSEVPPRNALNLWKNGAVALALEGADGQARMLGEHNPLPVAFAPGAASDPDSAREVTLQQVLTALLALGGNTDGLEALATQQKAVLDQMAAYVNDVEGLLTLIGNSTDGLEALLTAIGVKDDAVLAKLTDLLAKDEQIRVLLAAQAAKTETQPVSAASLPLPAGASTSALQTAGNTVLSNILTAVGLLGTEATQAAIRNALQGTLLVRANPDAPAIITLNMAGGSSASDPILLNTQAISAIDLGPNWTAADLTVDHSTDGGTTWYPMYDAFGNPLQYRIAANRSVAIPLADLMRRGRIRFRSGVPGAYVNQAVITVLTLTVVTL